MEEADFRRRLELFPVVRSPDYHVDLDPSRGSTSARSSAPNLPVEDWQDAREEEGEWAGAENCATDSQGPFWEKLRSAAEKKMGAAEAKRFCKAFERIHRKLVLKELSSDAARSFFSTTDGLVIVCKNDNGYASSDDGSRFSKS